MGEPITVAEADEMIFGYVLLNDWSARDIQAWESQPLGPFQGKVFATSISPWIVAKAALEPFRVWTPARERPLLPYLREAGPMLYDIKLEAMIRPEGAARPTVVSRANYCEMYYSAAQQLAQHAVGGCKMETGDLLGSGTISGPTREAAGSMLEALPGRRRAGDAGDRRVAALPRRRRHRDADRLGRGRGLSHRFRGMRGRNSSGARRKTMVSGAGGGGARPAVPTFPKSRRFPPAAVRRIAPIRP